MFAVILGLYMQRRGKRHADHAAELQQSREQGLNGLASLHPVVDTVRCMGSSACIKAGPEAALGIVGGKAVLIS